MKLGLVFPGVLVGCALISVCFISSEDHSVVLAQKLSARAKHAIHKLVDDYAMSCRCKQGEECVCATKAADVVRVALSNAVERQFAPPNLYDRTKDGYAYRIRGFQKPRPEPRRQRPSPDPVTVYQNAIETPTSKPEAIPKPVPKPIVNGLPPIPVSSRFVQHVDPVVYSRAHASWKPSSHRIVARDQQSKAMAARTSQLYQLPMLVQSKPTEEEEEDPNDIIFNSKWFSDWMDYSNLILSDRVLQEAERDSHLPAQPKMAIELPYQLGQEADFADWDAAFSEDAVVPFRVADGRESNYPDLDANDDFPGAVLEGYGGETADQEEYANFLARQAEEPQPHPTSVDGWLRDSPAY